MAATGSPTVSLWFADGTNYPGQDDITARQDRLAEALGEVYAALPEGIGMLLEYKLFEPGLLHHGRARLGHFARALPGSRRQGQRAGGHRPPRAWDQHRVHRRLLLRLGRLGGFHFNSRFYADDDLLVGAADPYPLFRIMNEIVAAGARLPRRRESRSCSTSATTSSRKSRPSSARS